jgi:hypothetical protein
MFPEWGRILKERKMDLIFGVIIVGAILIGVFISMEESGFGREHKAWKYALIALAIGVVGLWYFMTQPAQWVTKTYTIADTFNSEGNYITFNKPVLIKKRVVGYDWCWVRGSLKYSIDTEGGCK